MGLVRGHPNQGSADYSAGRGQIEEPELRERRSRDRRTLHAKDGVSAGTAFPFIDRLTLALWRCAASLTVGVVRE
jgi:hypothetical protein